MPIQTSPCLASVSLRFLAEPCASASCRACCAAPDRSPAGQAIPAFPQQAIACHRGQASRTLPMEARSCRASVSLPRRALPDRAVQCRTLRSRASSSTPNPSSPGDAMPAVPCRPLASSPCQQRDSTPSTGVLSLPASSFQSGPRHAKPAVRHPADRIHDCPPFRVRGHRGGRWPALWSGQTTEKSP